MEIERIKPGHPEQNGRHERMHRTLKKEATKPAAANVLQQQARFRSERVTYVLGINCHPCDRNRPGEEWRARPELNRRPPA